VTTEAIELLPALFGEPDSEGVLHRLPDEQYTSEAGLREQHPEESNVHEGPFGRQLVPREVSTGQAAGHDAEVVGSIPRAW